jgi:hypothetical protein
MKKIPAEARARYLVSVTRKKMPRGKAGLEGPSKSNPCLIPQHHQLMTIGGLVSPQSEPWKNHKNSVYKYVSIHVPVVSLGAGGCSTNAAAPIWIRESSLTAIALPSSGPRPMPSNF